MYYSSRTRTRTFHLYYFGEDRGFLGGRGGARADGGGVKQMRRDADKRPPRHLVVF